MRLIEIHGDGGRDRNWTDGCVALSNPHMEEGSSPDSRSARIARLARHGPSQRGVIVGLLGLGTLLVLLTGTGYQYAEVRVAPERVQLEEDARRSADPATVRRGSERSST